MPALRPPGLWARAYDKPEPSFTPPPPGGLLFNVDLQVPTFSFGSAAGLPPGLLYTRAASPLAVQWGTGLVFDMSFFAGSANVYYSGKANDAWLSGGLALEEGRTNLCLNWRNLGAASWTLSAGATQVPQAGQLDPFGVPGARLVTVLDLGFLGESVASGATGPVTFSCFTIGTPNANLFRTVGARVATTFASPGAWSRLSITADAGGSSSAAVPVDGRNHSGVGGFVNGGRAAYIDVVHREAGAFPTNPIPTTGTTATRAPTFAALSLAKMSEGLVAGRLQLELSFRPMGARGEHSADPHLTWADANNRITINATTGIVTIAVGGVTNTTATGMTWARDDKVEVFVCYGGGVATSFQYRVNDGAPVTLAIVGAALGTITAADTYLCSASTAGAHLTNWFYYARAHTPGRRPTWVG